MDNDWNPIVCSDCDSVPRLCETPYSEMDYVVTCECDHHSVGVSDAVNGSNLVQPITGKWSNIDHDHDIW